MATTLLIHYDPATPDQATWSHASNEGELTSRITSGSLQDAAVVAQHHKTVVLLDSSNVHLNHVQLPTSNRQKMLRAVPYALEEQLAEDIEDFHFVIGKTDPGYGTPVAGIRKDTIENLLSVFQQADISIDAVIPDAICTPAAPGQWSVLIYGDKALLQYGDLIGTVIDTNNLSLLLQARLSKAESKPEKIACFYLDGEDPESLLTDIDAEIEVIKLAYNTHPLVVFCGEYNKARSLNLLQGAYKPRRKSSGQWYRWRLAGSMAAVWLILYLGINLFELNKLKSRNNEIGYQIESIYKKSFPGSKRIVNPRVQMEQKLKELRGGGGSQGSQFLALLSRSVPVISSQKDIKVQSIDFRNNRMDIGLTGTNLQSVETLNRQLSKDTKLKAEITSATSEKNSAKGSIRLEMPRS
ncbi:MAG: type II secretion system protein GspL [Thiotrichales bacterium]|nr:MAG: type II secretion system protein GspL [Thiotrichales bacterium]